MSFSRKVNLKQPIPQSLSWNVYHWNFIYTNAKLIVICKPDLEWRYVNTQLNTENAKKHCFLAAAILLLNGKIIIT